MGVSSLVNNFMVGVRSDKFGEGFLDYCIRRLAELDHRSKRFVMCDLMREGLEKSDKYSAFVGQLKREYSESLAESAEKCNV